MSKARINRGDRRHDRIEIHKPGFVIPAPDAPWIECEILDISEDGVCIDVGALSVPRLFGLSFTAGGEVLRVCLRVWRQGELIGARFVTSKELRQGAVAPSSGARAESSSSL